MHAQGKLHRAVHLYLFNSAGHLLLQGRSQHIAFAPDQWSISVSGHVDAGEASSVAIRRELQEELGIAAADLHFVFSHRRDMVLHKTYIDRQFNDVYVGWHDFQCEDLVLNTQEVSEVKVVPTAVWSNMVAEGTDELISMYAQEWQEVKYFFAEQMAYTRHH